MDAVSARINLQAPFRLERMAAEPKATIGYYTVTQDSRTGWTGGLLILNGSGRPLEFQCTLPVRPSRAHEILYGPTLRSHIIGEVIGPLLLQKCRSPVSMLCCDQPESLTLENSIKSPVALIKEAAEDEEGPITPESLTGFNCVDIAGCEFYVPIERLEATEKLAEEFAELPDAVEPFERIREAIKEAHSQIARQSQARAA